MALSFPHFNPILIQIGPLKIYWYGLSYALGIILGWKYSLFLVKKYAPSLSKSYFDAFVIWAVMGVILGGRLGHIIFYQWDYYLAHPLEIFMTWKGGMSFHGGLLGVVIGALIFCHKHKINFFKFADVWTTVAPIGLGMGRIANFINGELYGTRTSLPWGIVFPRDHLHLLRHPSQLYEAIGEGLILGLLLRQAWKKDFFCTVPGRITGLFFLGYGIIRFFVEYVREPEIVYWFSHFYITQGQILSIPLICLGMYWIKPLRKIIDK